MSSIGGLLLGVRTGDERRGRRRVASRSAPRGIAPRNVGECRGPPRTKSEDQRPDGLYSRGSPKPP
jgi:hypothetical protein